MFLNSSTNVFILFLLYNLYLHDSYKLLVFEIFIIEFVSVRYCSRNYLCFMVNGRNSDEMDYIVCAMCQWQLTVQYHGRSVNSYMIFETYQILENAYAAEKHVLISVRM